jgi:hypothetical protein
MIFARLAYSSRSFRCLCGVIALVVVGPVFSPAMAETPAAAVVGPDSPPPKAEAPAPPSFRKGLWHFVRTMELVIHKHHRQRVLERDVTRCVDPNVAMKATFSSPSVGNCVSAKPEKSDNKYTFSNRCDYLGPVSTVITVHSDESYTELNELNVGNLPRAELVVARRIGDCEGDPENSGKPSVSAKSSVSFRPPASSKNVGPSD